MSEHEKTGTAKPSITQHEGGKSGSEVQTKSGAESQSKSSVETHGKTRAESKGDHNGATTGQGAAAGAAKLSIEQRTKITTIIKKKNVEPTHLNISVHVGARVPSHVHFYLLPHATMTKSGEMGSKMDGSRVVGKSSFCAKKGAELKCTYTTMASCHSANRANGWLCVQNPSSTSGAK